MAKVRGAVLGHPVLLGLGFVAVVALATGWWVWQSMFGLGSTVVYYGVPDAPELAADGPDQVVYRIDPTRSEVRYEVEETLAGRTNTAVGTTKGVAGDVLVDYAEPESSEVGEIVVNVQQLDSDHQLRDERLRHDFLESNEHPLVTFVPTAVEGIGDDLGDGSEHEVQVTGDLTVKDATHPVTLDATVVREGDELHIDAEATVLMSDFGVGPINIVGLARTSDEVLLAFDLVAEDAEQLGTVTELAFEEQDVEVQEGEGPSFHDEVQPILEDSCAGCHQPDASGASVWELATAEDAQRVASGLGLAVESRYMPPWLASSESVDFQHDLRLSDEEVATIAAWADAGGQLDVDGDAPVEPTAEQVRHPDRDVVMTADAPYQGSTDLPNDYRCLVMDPGITEPTYLAGYEFVPDQTEYVHHALIFRMDAETRAEVDERDAADEGTGYECFGGAGARDELVAGWAPGQMPGVYPDGVGLPMEPGDFFVVQVHYHFVHAAPQDRSELVLDVADDQAAITERLDVTTYLGPAEIPCGEGESGPLCDREAARAALAEEYGPSGAFIADALLRACDATAEEVGVLDGTVARSTCDLGVGERGAGEIMSVLGHMHEIGSTFRMTLNPDTPEERVLLDIPRWDFNWQFHYAPVEQIVLDADDVIRVECSWDRTLIDPALPDRYVLWSEGTEDEMCYSTITTRSPLEG
ncbi:hypothetical protein B7486_52835 [cyanobacterium TDX16]|nr:hypothetical protein B7486_52835 [cyanobacterium TDX16]